MLNIQNLCDFARGTSSEGALPELQALPEQVRIAYEKKLQKAADDVAESVAEDLVAITKLLSANRERTASQIRSLKRSISALKRASAQRDQAYDYARSTGNWIPLACILGLFDPSRLEGKNEDLLKIL